jgi:hypothetical protein
MGGESGAEREGDILMEIKIRNVGNSNYKEICLKINDITIDLGMLDDDECEKMVNIFKEAIYDLTNGKENYLDDRMS